MQFKVTPERLENLTLDQAIAIEAMGNGEQVTLRDLKAVLSAFLLDEEGGQYMADRKAAAVLGKLTIRELRDIGKQFGEQVKDAVLPPVSGGS